MLGLRVMIRKMEQENRRKFTLLAKVLGTCDFVSEAAAGGDTGGEKKMRGAVVMVYEMV